MEVWFASSHVEIDARLGGIIPLSRLGACGAVWSRLR
jgi:hypothetical protein